MVDKRNAGAEAPQVNAPEVVSASDKMKENAEEKM